MRHRRWLPLLAIVAALGTLAPPVALASPRDERGRQDAQSAGQQVRQAAGRAAAAAQAAQATAENTPRGRGNQVAAAQAVQAALERVPQGGHGGEAVARTTPPSEVLEQRNGGRQGPGGHGGQAGNRGNGGPGAAAAGAPRERGPNGGHNPPTTAAAGAPGGSVTGPAEPFWRGPRGGGSAAMPGNATPPPDQNEEPRQGPRRPVAPPATINVAPPDPPGEPRRGPARITQPAGNGSNQTAARPPGPVAPATTTVGAANELIVQQGQRTPRTTVVTERGGAPAPDRVVRPRWDRDLRPALAPLPDHQLVVRPPGLPPRPLPVFAPEPFLPLLPPRVLVPVPVPVLVVVPQPVVVLVPVFVPPPLIVQRLVPAPCLIPVPEVLPGPLPLVVPELVPGTCLVLVPVVVPQPGQALFPPLYGAVLPAISTVFSPDPFQELPLQFVPVAGTESDYLLAHPALFCDVAAAQSCEEASEQLNAVAPGFGTTVTDGPEGYGVYLTYDITAEAWD